MPRPTKLRSPLLHADLSAPLPEFSSGAAHAHVKPSDGVSRKG